MLVRETGAGAGKALMLTQPPLQHKSGCWDMAHGEMSPERAQGFVMQKSHLRPRVGSAALTAPPCPTWSEQLFPQQLWPCGARCHTLLPELQKAGNRDNACSSEALRTARSHAAGRGCSVSQGTHQSLCSTTTSVSQLGTSTSGARQHLCHVPPAMPAAHPGANQPQAKRAAVLGTHGALPASGGSGKAQGRAMRRWGTAA